MKKHTFIYFLIAIIACTSCQAVSDWLQMDDDGSITYAMIWSDENNVEGALNVCYNAVPYKGFAYGGEPLFAFTDDGWSSNDGQGGIAQMMYSGNYSAESHPIYNSGSFYSTYLVSIRHINQFLEKINLKTDEGEYYAKCESDEIRDRFYSEARVLRAFYMTELLKWFGPLPILDYVAEANTTYEKTHRASITEYVDFIMDDLAAGMDSQNLPWRTRLGTDAMRTHKALAVALQSTVTMLAASPLYNPDNKAELWETAYQYTKNAVDSLKANGYELFTVCTREKVYGKSSAAAYRQQLCTGLTYTSSPADKETIYCHSYTGGSICGINYVGSDLINTTACGVCPTQELVDCYETIDGVTVLDLAKPYKDEKHLQPNFNPENTLYNEQNPYENRDPRLDQTVLHQGSPYTWDKERVIDVTATGLNARSTKTSDKTHSRTGYYFCKTVPPNSTANSALSTVAYKHYTLAEMLLNLAECAAQSGHTAEAYAAVNEVRDRVSMPALPQGLSKDMLLLRIKNERRVELACGENRYFDVRRWHKPDEDMSAENKYFTGIDITYNSDSTEFYYKRVPVRDSERFGYEAKCKLLPIPKTEASMLLNITGEDMQNPGW